MENGHGVADPRPDLIEDSGRWLTLLTLAHRDSGDDPFGVYGALDCLRCLGARLDVSARGGVNLRRGAIEEEEYAKIKETQLQPQADRLTHYLRRVAA